jgi:hypothetical protein
VKNGRGKEISVVGVFFFYTLQSISKMCVHTLQSISKMCVYVEYKMYSMFRSKCIVQVQRLSYVQYNRENVSLERERLKEVPSL